MLLSKSTTDQIRKEAEDVFPVCLYHEKDPRALGKTIEKDFNSDNRYGYITGATAWAVWKEKAEVYKKALKEILECNNRYRIPKIATKALDQFK